ncbi:ATP-binding protein [Lacunisphaera limnophila]|uniref:ATP-binding protein n=1 Tax=Lacunisphaera limnophila TaxID=1838286 RepID=UPI001471C2B0|nr:ATP-binding protein [Lacunisphaera limnophila]
MIDVLPEPALITAGSWEAGGVDILHVNDRFCALTGYTAAELEGRNTRLLHGPRTDAALLRQARAAGASAREGSGEGWLYQKAGTEFFAQWNYRPLTPAAAGPLVVVYHDHSEFWRQREALLQSQKLDTIGLLASGVAHDFNNLLSIINGYCEIMEPKIAGTPAAAKDLREIHRAGLKAAAIARQILEFSRRPEAETIVINYNTLIREISEIIRRVGGEEITLELRLASDLGNARINPTHFQQVLLNLCFNARDAMPQGGKLTIRTRNHTVPPRAGGRDSVLEPGAYVVLEVADQGIGMEPPVLARIFEPFYTTKPHGTGLGLPIAQRIVRQAQGQLAVESAPGRGTRFTLYLPETAEPEQVSTTVLSSLPATQGTEAVLIIEHEEALRKMIAGILGLDGYTVTEAANVDEAERIAISPQLVIADTATGPGQQWLQRLRAANPALLLVSTAAEPPAWPDRTGRTLLHLPKPFALSSLLQEVRRLLDAKGK